MNSLGPSVIAFDHGQKRIGVAIASLAARLPSPIQAIKQSDRVFDDIRALAKEHNACAFVVGLPRSLNGDETAQSRLARSFSRKLANKLKLPVYLQDESVTSKQAEVELAARGVRYNKEHVDSLAAVYILEDFLQAHPEVKQ